ncbi:MAG: alpha/beta fold hydrolase [Brevundimonas sp.]|uniref:serine aminopeptidase domain-containing protein n=1 Tax=Brevundimonas sp. TaxID=1871086 RepID=UPI001228FA92|nr:alpha/beta hydrolase [Brevundimonas sp.]RZJ17440.1 MAG: alpha/beta fold hydrolase [Brevundimonas sp.]
MTRPLSILAAILCLGCAPAPDTPVAPVDPAPVEAVRPAGPHTVGVMEGPQTAGGRLYYPALDGGEARAITLTEARREKLTQRFGPGVAEALGRAVTVARVNAAPARGRFPLVIFAPGSNMAAGDYRLLMEDLASRGYVVLALDPNGAPPASEARYGAAADELIAALTRIKTDAPAPVAAIMDTGHVALIGHSLGGAAAFIALPRAPGAVAINLDGDVMAAPAVPPAASILYLIGQTPPENDRSRARRAGTWRDLSAGVADAVVLQITDFRHFDYADAALLQEGVPEPMRQARFGPLGGQKAHALTTDLIAAFLDSRLKGDGAAWPAALARHPEAAAPTTW